VTHYLIEMGVTFLALFLLGGLIGGLAWHFSRGRKT
jgi:cbb3-type cytochrome oxidase subunit 3